MRLRACAAHTKFLGDISIRARENVGDISHPRQPGKGVAVTDGNVNQGGGSASTSSTLLERVRAQDQEAWQRLVHLYSPLVYGWCRRSGLQDADAADVGQEVFRDVAGAIAGFRRDR